MTTSTDDRVRTLAVAGSVTLDATLASVLPGWRVLPVHEAREHEVDVLVVGAVTRPALALHRRVFRPRWVVAVLPAQAQPTAVLATVDAGVDGCCYATTAAEVAEYVTSLVGRTEVSAASPGASAAPPRAGTS